MTPSQAAAIRDLSEELQRLGVQERDDPGPSTALLQTGEYPDHRSLIILRTLPDLNSYDM